MSKIGVLIPSTTKGLNCRDYRDTHFYKIFFKSFYNTISKKHKYIIYLVVDDDDEIYQKKENREKLLHMCSLVSCIELKFISSAGIEKGWVTKMWNRAFKQAYNDGCDYFYQCGDDIEFLDINWDDISIEALKKRNNVGVTGPYDYGRELSKNKKFLMTQSFVSRKHMEFFGFYFPPEIKNWYCDDWITYVYHQKNLCFPIRKRIINKGGDPRYTPEGLNDNGRVEKSCINLIHKYKINIKN